jgi:hypothetical protein
VDLHDQSVVSKKMIDINLTSSHLNIRPSVAQGYLSGLLVDVGKCIVDMGEMLVWNLLGRKLAIVYSPVTSGWA